MWCTDFKLISNRCRIFLTLACVVAFLGEHGQSTRVTGMHVILDGHYLSSNKKRWMAR
jgi:hypothetical protein